MMSSSIGIDLGTTYCCVASYKNMVLKVVETQASENTTPSFVAFDEDGSVIAGLAAKNRIHLKTENCLFAIKRVLGRKFSDPGLQEDLKHWPFEIIEGSNDSPLIRLSNGDTFRPEQISAKLLSFLRIQAENFLAPEIVKKAVITVPAHFNDGQRQATKDAGEIAGFEEIHILNEPTAAAIAYNHLNNQFQDWKTILVFDLGGGTLDVSIMKMKNKEIVMLGVGGDTHLGGEDFDNALVDYCVEEFKKKEEIDLRAGQNSTAEERQQANRRLRRLKMQCEKTKISLSATKNYPVSVEAIHDDVSMHINITRDTFETLNNARFDKCIDILEKAIGDANLDKTQIDQVILVGGSSKIPAIQNRIARYFGKAPSKNIKCSEAVALGAAIQANIDNQYSELGFKINDICPITIGIEIFTKGTVSFSPIIPKNTPVPCTITEKYHIPFENMKNVAINVFEGEDSSVKNNNLLGSFIISSLPENCPKGELLEVTMELSPEGILHCTAMCPKNFATNRLEVMGSKGRLSREEIERMKLQVCSICRKRNQQDTSLNRK